MIPSPPRNFGLVTVLQFLRWIFLQASVSPPKEVSIDFINFLADLLGQKGASHDVGGYGGSDGVDKSNITAYYKLRIGSNRRLNQN